MKTVKFKQWNCVVEKKYYGNGALALLLMESPPDPIDPSPVAKPTVNIVREHYHPNLRDKIKFSEDLPKNQCYIKEYGGNEGAFDALLDAGVIRIPDVPVAIDINGHGDIVILAELVE